MLKSQISALTEQASFHFEQAKIATTTASQIAHSEQANGLLKEARAVAEKSRRESVLVYFEFMLNIKKEFSFESYLEFCIRNGLKQLSEEDYLELETALLTDTTIS